MTARRLALLGPVVALASVLSYFGYFARFPDLRDVPWLNMPLAWCGVALSFVALRRSPRGARKLAMGSTALSLLPALLFVGYVGYLSRQLPPPTEKVAIGAVAPSFELPDALGATVRLADLRGTKAIVVFYRGYW